MKYLNTAIKTGLKRITQLLMVMSLLTFTSMASAAGGGDFISKKYDVKGDWSLIQRDGSWVISLGDSFKTKSGPDLKLFLSPLSIDEVTGRTATKGSALVSVLQSITGSQEYVLPANINPADFKSLLVHCEKYSVLWGGANL